MVKFLYRRSFARPGEMLTHLPGHFDSKQLIAAIKIKNAPLNKFTRAFLNSTRQNFDAVTD
jgi:hypothetical protein